MYLTQVKQQTHVSIARGHGLFALQLQLSTVTILE